MRLFISMKPCLMRNFLVFYENTEENTASFFFLENDCIEYVFDSFTEDVNRMKYHAELVNVQDFFSADMDEEGFAA